MHVLLMVPIGRDVGLSTVSLGVVRAFENQGLKSLFLDPVTHTSCDLDTQFLQQALCELDEPFPIEFVETLLSQNQGDHFIEFLLACFNHRAKEMDVVVVRGVISHQLRGYAAQLNFDIAQALDAEVIFVMNPGHCSCQVVSEQIEMAAHPYGGIRDGKILGCMFNKVGAPVDQHGNVRIDFFDLGEKIEETRRALAKCTVFKEKNFTLLGCFPWERHLTALRVKDIQKHLGAHILHAGKIGENRVMHFAIAGATVENMALALKADTMLLTSGDRSDVILATCLACLGGTHIAALLLTGGHVPGPNTKRLCEPAIRRGLPILSVQTDSLRTAVSLQDLSMEIPEDDDERREMVKEFVAHFIDAHWIQKLSQTYPTHALSPPAFRFQLIEKAKKAGRTIILPEGEEPRILNAARICAHRKIAQIVLLGNRERIAYLAKEYDVPMGNGVASIDADAVRERYVQPLMALRKHKGIDEKQARESLNDNITLATMMLKVGEVDGLVAGVDHTTAQTVLPALKLIKTKESALLVSSIFFMCLPTQVLVYGDCAVNQDPTAEELADIAVQSAASSEQFGIPARIAMISYSTGGSGSGAAVEKVKRATQIVKQTCPHLLIDGPLQYDAAFTPEVAKRKAPNSPVAGRATVYIFPDLNTANTTYKAVQRSAHALSIGPVLQGLTKPVNDLSRGASIEDIVFTIAITCGMKST